jgi:hypothetical protein
MGNCPIGVVDRDGKFVHIIIGAAIGGLVNLAIKAYQGKIHSWGDGLAAFGIGAVAGAVGAATGGAAFLAAGGAAAGAGGFLAGFAGGAVGSAFSMPIQSLGNTAYFGDPLMTPKEYAAGILTGGVLGGAINGGIALGNRGNFWTGPSPIPSPTPLEVPQLNYEKPKLNYAPKLDKNIANLKDPLRNVADELPATKPDGVIIDLGDASSRYPTTYYPANNGFAGKPTQLTLGPGQVLDRYGSETGRFLSPAGTPLQMRALPPGTRSLNTYIVVKPFTVESGFIAPAFNQSGGGVQYLAPVSIVS